MKGGAAELITRRIRDRVGRSDVAAAEPEADSGTMSKPAPELLELHASYEVRDLDLDARTPVLGPLLTRLRRILLRPVADLAARQTDVNALISRLLSQLSNRAAVLEATEAKRVGQEESIRALKKNLRTLSSASGQPAPPDLQYDAFVARFDDDASTGERLERHVESFAGREHVLDLAAGNGNFLRLLRDTGTVGRGVENDPRLAALCREQGLDVRRKDPLTHLRDLAPDGLDAIYASRLIERLSARDAVDIVRFTRRALKPGGLLVLESANPCSALGVAAFAKDFRNVRLYDGEAMAWLLEQEEFADVRLHFFDAGREGEADAFYSVSGLKP